MKRTYEELTHDVVMRDHWIEELRAENTALAAALVAKDEALDKYRGQIDRFGNHTAADALAIQPHAALVAKIKADAVAEQNKYLASIGMNIGFTESREDYADRIERGEV